MSEYRRNQQMQLAKRLIRCSSIFKNYKMQSAGLLVFLPASSSTWTPTSSMGKPNLPVRTARLNVLIQMLWKESFVWTPTPHNRKAFLWNGSIKLDKDATYSAFVKHHDSYSGQFHNTDRTSVTLWATITRLLFYIHMAVISESRDP